MRAQLSRTRFDLRYPSQPPDEKTGIEAIPWQVPVPLPLPDPSRLRLPQCPYSNLVPVLHSDLPQRTGMAGATDACHRFGLLAAGQLFPGLLTRRKRSAGWIVSSRPNGPSCSTASRSSSTPYTPRAFANTPSPTIGPFT